MEAGVRKPKRICFVEMMGVPGSYDASVYDELEDRDREGVWFQKRYHHVPGISIETTNVCTGDPLPRPGEVDGLVLAGSYNSVHDQTPWQCAVLDWLPGMREAGLPLLGICGSHQLMGYYLGARVEWLADGPYAGTFPTELTEAGRNSPLMGDIDSGDSFHYANAEHVTVVPEGASLLASSGRVPVAALDYGGQWYSTQFHPEASAITLGTIWKNSKPELSAGYHDDDRGDRLVENFFRIVRDGGDRN